LQDLPSEIFLLIASHLDIPQVLLLRQASRYISELTRDKSLWLAFLEDQRRSGEVPLPTVAQDYTNVVSSTIESIAVSTKRALDRWALPRETRPIIHSQGGVLSGLNLFADTWLLVVYQDGLVYLWNIQGPAIQDGCRAILDLRAPGIKWKSYSAVLSPTNHEITLAISNTACKTTVYSVNIGNSDSNLRTAFNVVRSFECSIVRTIRCIDVANRLVLFSYSDHVVDVVRWHKDNDCETFTHSLESAEELFNCIIAIRLLGSHFLAIRTHTIELHPCLLHNSSPSSPHPRGIVKHALRFPLRDGAVSVSDAESIHDLTSTSQRIHVRILAYDAHSLSLYTVSSTLPKAGDIDMPTMKVSLVGEVLPPPPSSHGQRSHWFVSAHSLGPKAIRALWIERASLTMTRSVMVCTLNHHATWHEMQLTAKSIYTLRSYDLRDDLTHCALEEMSGRIVLGNRAGHVFLLA
ncbi:hypothetical protein C8J57DRAFT_1335578, partial [Mycena rebaudengoi]